MDQLGLAAVARAAADHSPAEAVARIPAAGAAEDQGEEAVAHNHEAAYSVAVDQFDHTGFDLGSGLVGARNIGSGRRVERWACRMSWDCSCSFGVVGVADAVGSLAVEIAGVVVVERSFVDA